MKIFLKIILSIVDFFFTPEKILTMLMSAGMGVLIFYIIHGNLDVEVGNKFIWIISGLPAWLLIRCMYWEMRLLLFPRIETRWSHFKQNGFYL